jgi:hypothetical protein
LRVGFPEVEDGRHLGDLKREAVAAVAAVGGDVLHVDGRPAKGTLDRRPVAAHKAAEEVAGNRLVLREHVVQQGSSA